MVAIVVRRGKIMFSSWPCGKRLVTKLHLNLTQFNIRSRSYSTLGWDHISWLSTLLSIKSLQLLLVPYIMPNIHLFLNMAVMYDIAERHASNQKAYGARLNGYWSGNGASFRRRGTTLSTCSELQLRSVAYLECLVW